jgi:hypothetical protein
MAPPQPDCCVGFLVGFPAAGDRDLKVRQALGALLEVQVQNIE